LAVKRNSLVFRLIIPIFIIVAAVSASLVISMGRISGHIVDEFIAHTLGDYADETIKIIEKAQSDLITARLIDQAEVVGAKKRTVVEAISLLWQRRGIEGQITDEKGSLLISTLPQGISYELRFQKDSVHQHLKTGNRDLHYRIVSYPSWGWRMAIGTTVPASYLVNREVNYLIPIMTAGLILMSIAVFIILRRNLQGPVNSFVSAIDSDSDIPSTGIQEFDNIGVALNNAFAKLRERTAELAAELDERRRAEAALQESEERFRTTLLSVGDAIIATDSSGNVTIMNSVAEELTGWTGMGAIGLPLNKVFVIVNEETRKTVESPVDRVLREGIIVGLANHTILISREGRECPIADAAAPIRDNQGEIYGVVLVFRDQTEERRAENSLREEKNKSEAIIAAMGDGISIQDRNFRIIYQNEVHKRLVGSHTGEICYKAYETHETVCDGCPVDRTFIDGEVHTAQRTVKRPEGLRYFDITTSPLRDASGEIVAGIEIVRDITSIKHGEEQLRQAQKMEGIGQLAGGIAHDFNNILTAIIGYASILEYKLGDEGLKSYVTNILESTERASSLTKSLLAFSRKHPADIKPMDLNGLTSGFRDIMGRLIGEDISLEIRLSPEDLVVSADKGQIEQVLLNLVTNARDAMPNGGRIIIEIGKAVIDMEPGDLARGSYAVIAVSDNGSGIDPNVREHIFEPFFTTKEVGKGTGLGLSVVYGIVRKHNGSIHVYSEPGQGTTFRVYLPLSGEAAAGAADITKKALSGGKETILLVEDNAETRKVAKMVLGEFGYTVIEAVDGEDAVEVFTVNREKIDLVLSDLVMPKKNGREACEEILRIRPDMKVVLMSGYTADIISQKGALDSRFEFLTKPLNPTVLLQKIRHMLDS